MYIYLCIYIYLYIYIYTHIFIFLKDKFTTDSDGVIRIVMQLFMPTGTAQTKHGVKTDKLSICLLPKFTH